MSFKLIHIIELEHCCYKNTHEASNGFHKKHPVMRCTI